jgi:hypothetical protein
MDSVSTRIQGYSAAFFRVEEAFGFWTDIFINQYAGTDVSEYAASFLIVEVAMMILHCDTI